MTTLPEHIKIGNYVQVAEWIGRVDDIAVGKSHTLILVSSPKQVYRHSRPEWLEFDFSIPEMIAPAESWQYVRECDRYAERSYNDRAALIEAGCEITSAKKIMEFPVPQAEWQYKKKV